MCSVCEIHNNECICLDLHLFLHSLFIRMFNKHLRVYAKALRQAGAVMYLGHHSGEISSLRAETYLCAVATLCYQRRGRMCIPENP